MRFQKQLAIIPAAYKIFILHCCPWYVKIGPFLACVYHFYCDFALFVPRLTPIVCMYVYLWVYLFFSMHTALHWILSLVMCWYLNVMKISVIYSFRYIKMCIHNHNNIIYIIPTCTSPCVVCAIHIHACTQTDWVDHCTKKTGLNTRLSLKATPNPRYDTSEIPSHSQEKVSKFMQYNYCGN